MNAPLRFTCPEDGCDGDEWTAHGMSYIGQVVQVRELRCTECGAVVEQTNPMLVRDAEQVATDGGEQT